MSQNDRLERLRATIDEMLRQKTDLFDARCGFMHLYGVSCVCALLALKRGLDPELCTTAGMLHDVWAYKADPTDHARLGAIEAGKILRETGDFTDSEITTICTAIANHSNKGEIHDPMSELLKDADVLQHHLYNTSFEVKSSEAGRLNLIFKELGIEK